MLTPVATLGRFFARGNLAMASTRIAAPSEVYPPAEGDEQAKHSGTSSKKAFALKVVLPQLPQELPSATNISLPLALTDFCNSL